VIFASPAPASLLSTYLGKGDLALTFQFRRNNRAATGFASALALLSAVSYPSMGLAQDVVLEAGQTDTDGVVLANGGSLTNRGAISHAGDGVSYPGPGGGVAFILNEATGTITATGGWAVGINGDLGRFENAGSVTTDTDAALGVAGDLGTFLNTGTMITSDGAGVGVNGSVGTFDNRGAITGHNDPAVVLNGPVGRFVNTGSLTSPSNWTTTYFDAGVLEFENTGSILNTGNGNGVEFNTGNGPVGTFVNTGTIRVTGDGTAVGIYGDTFAVGSIVNGGTVQALTESAFNIDPMVGAFTNSGLIEGGSWDAVFFGGGVQQFHNTATGVIRNLDSAGNAGNGVVVSTDLINGGAVGSFINDGTILADLSGGTGTGVGFYEDGNGAFTVGSFANAGTISGANNGVESVSAIGTFTNSGSIASANFTSVRLQGAVGSFTNSGVVTAAQGRGVEFFDHVTAFNNTGTIQSFENGVTFRSTFGAASNAGTIVSTADSGQIGVRIDEAGGTFTNTGTIRGAAGVVYILNAPGPNTFINAGTIDGMGGAAIVFDAGADGGNDALLLRTGSRLFGSVFFGAGDDTLDLSEFRGNALLRAFDVETLVAGGNLVFDLGANEFGVVEPFGVTASAPLVALDTTTQIRNLIASKLATPVSGTGEESLLLGYAPIAENTAASAAIGELDTVSSNTLWASLLAGGSTGGGPVAVNNLFGGIVAGGHARVGSGNLGLLGGATTGRVDINNGGQRITASTGIAGVYGDLELGVVSLDYSLLGGAAGNTSEREVVTPGGMQTATGQFGSWFISPSLGLAVPVLATEQGELRVTGRLSYVGGSVGGYTETGSSLDLVVGAQTISLLDARLGLAGDYDAGAGMTVSANAGVFAQSNLGGSSTPVTLFGQTQSAVAPASTELGVYAGAGLSADLGNGLKLSAAADGQVRFDGHASASLQAGLSNSF
jgi:hypothetical protein